MILKSLTLAIPVEERSPSLSARRQIWAIFVESPGLGFRVFFPSYLARTSPAMGLGFRVSQER